MNIAGLPLHVLVVHAAVVFGPLSALAALAYVSVPRYRDLLRWPTLVLVLIATAAIWLAFFSGESFYDSDRFANVSGELQDNIEKHDELAHTLRWVTTGFAIVTVAATWLHDRTGPTRVVLNVLVAAFALATLVYVALTGDAGARSVWS
jgi:cytochrome c biogenesis protein CcdA